MHAAAQFDFTMPAILTKRRKWYLATCPPLGVASQGPTKGEALKNLRDAIRGFLADCYERGTLSEVLKQAGFVSAQAPRRSKRFKRAHWLSIPIALLAREHSAA
jgi:predicted RNase H-like HicB family nuclease